MKKKNFGICFQINNFRLDELVKVPQKIVTTIQKNTFYNGVWLLNVNLTSRRDLL
jgi:hypothetical protein